MTNFLGKVHISGKFVDSKVDSENMGRVGEYVGKCDLWEEDEF